MRGQTGRRPAVADAPSPHDLPRLEPWRQHAPLEALAIERVRHRFGPVAVVDDVSLTVAPGEIVCLVGPSGCGKSTLLRIAAGLEDLQQGRISVVGRTVAEPGRIVPPERRGIGLVFQDYALFPHLSVLDNVRFGLRELAPAEQRRRAMATLEQVGMTAYADVYPHALSGGQQQRVALARALAPQPPVLLLDEPFSGLDTRLREQVRDDTLHVLKEIGAATLLVTHDPEEAMFLADRIALMREGSLVQVGSPVDLYNRPVNQFAASFFGEVNWLSGVIEGAAVETPLGRLGHGGLPDGTPVDVLIRPEALQLQVVGNGLPLDTGGTQARAGLPYLALVEASRLLGRTSLVHLRMPGGQDGSVHLHARIPGQFLPPEGSHVAVRLDERQAFVFARADLT